MKVKIIITGSAGFIGFHLSCRLCKFGFEVVGVDNLNDYYDVQLKLDRLAVLKQFSNFTFVELDIKDWDQVNKLFEQYHPEYVVNLAAQAGVRYSLENPGAYVDANLVGFVNVLEACRKFPVKHLLYASSSSVYGGNKVVPFSTNHNVDHPVSLYAATKKANELMAHTYSHLFGIPTTGLRFFTVYGPWGRPDMAYFSFTDKILKGSPIAVFNHGLLERDFTFIDDIVEGIVRLLDKIPEGDPLWSDENGDLSSSFAPYKIYNIGNNNPVKLMEFIGTLETVLGVKAKLEFKDMQPGDVLTTYADVSDLQRDVGFAPATSLKDGLLKFVEWYREYYNELINTKSKQ